MSQKLKRKISPTAQTPGEKSIRLGDHLCASPDLRPGVYTTRGKFNSEATSSRQHTVRNGRRRLNSVAGTGVSQHGSQRIVEEIGSYNQYQTQEGGGR